jgi:hypothetical protein
LEQIENITERFGRRSMCLLDKIESYRAAARLPATTFGRRAVRDPRLVLDLRRGRQPGPAMIRRVEAFMARHPI